MRRHLAGLATLLALLSPAAAAQDPLAEPIRLALASPALPVEPLAALGLMPLTIDVACPPADSPPPTNEPLQLSATGPTWAVVTVSPATLLVPDVTSCAPALRTTLQATVYVTTTAEAPAFATADVIVRAAMEGPAGTQEAEARAPIQAGYFAVIDPRVENPIRVAPPGAREIYAFTIDNFGNGPTRVEFSAVEVTDGWTVDLPEAAVIGARQTGDTATQGRFDVGLRSPGGGVFVNEPGIATIRVTGEYAGEQAANDTEEAQFSLLLTAKGSSVLGDRAETPATALPLALAGIAALALSRRRQAQ